MTELELIWRKKGKGDWNLCKSGFTTFDEVTALFWVIFEIELFYVLSGCYVIFFLPKTFYP